MAKALILSIFVLCFFAFGSSMHVPFKDCGSEGNIGYVDISSCSALPCPLKKGTNVNLAVQFTPSSSVTATKTFVHGIIAGVPVPYPVANSDACQGHGITCPMTSGETYIFKTVLPIKSMYPSIKVVVKWEMQDQTGKDVFCWEVPVEIID